MYICMCENTGKQHTYKVVAAIRIQPIFNFSLDFSIFYRCTMCAQIFLVSMNKNSSVIGF